MNIARRRVVGCVSIAIFILTGALIAPATVAPVVTVQKASASVDGSAEFPGGIFVPHTGSALTAAASLQSQGQIYSAAIDRQIAAQPTAIWLGDWYSNSQLAAEVGRVLEQARGDGKTPVFVTYAIPNRDCGGSSAGGLTSATYESWTQTLANSLRGSNAVVIEEPDALAGLSNCPTDTSTTTSLLYNATKALAAAGATVYLDAGNSNWVTSDVMIGRLWNSGLQFARGFSSNVSNFYTTSAEQSYDERLRAVSGKNYVIDVSRNGRGSMGNWCNPSDAGLGQNPRVVSDNSGLDATLWIKAPGESDGNCNGGPSAGQWFQAGAQGLYNNR
jgi:endoglucanase